MACAHGRSGARRHCVGGSPFIQSRRKVNPWPAGALVRDAVQKLECGQSSAEGGRSGGRRSSPLILFEVRACAACRPRTQRPVAPNATCQCGLRCRMDCCGCAASACVRCASQVCGLGAALEARSRSRRLRRLIHVQCAHDIGRCAVGWRAGAEQVSPGTPAAMTNVHDESRRRCGPTNVCFCFRPARTMVSRLSAGVLESAHLGRYSPTPASRCCGVLQRGYRCSGCFGHCEY